MSTKPTKNKQAATISFDQLGVLFDLKREHEALIIEQAKLERMQHDGPIESFHLAMAELHLQHRGYHARVKADPQQMDEWIKATIETRLRGIEAKMTSLGVTGIKRERPEPQYDDLDENIPF